MKFLKFHALAELSSNSCIKDTHHKGAVWQSKSYYISCEMNMYVLLDVFLFAIHEPSWMNPVFLSELHSMEGD